MQVMNDAHPHLTPTLSSSSKPVANEASKVSYVQERFSDALKDAIQSVNDIQQDSQEMTQKLITGQVENLHDVMIASEKAGVALQTTIEVRNKMLEAYETVMRMQL